MYNIICFTKRLRTYVADSNETWLGVHRIKFYIFCLSIYLLGEAQP
jgi:hypothetical protein